MNPFKRSLFVLLGVFCPLLLKAQDVPTTGQKIAFLGDSITAEGAQFPGGYVNLVAKGFETKGIKITIIPAGVSGNTSQDMLARIDSVLAQKPDWMTLSCGVNDVWHGTDGVPLDKYKENIRAIVDKAQAAGVRIVILTATMINEQPAANLNQKLSAYNDFLRDFAKERKYPLADLNADMQAALLPNPTGDPSKQLWITKDGVHMNAMGDEMMAAGVLKAFGFTQADLDKAQAIWLDIPNSGDEGDVLGLRNITARQFDQLRKMALAQNLTVHDLLQKELQKTVLPLLQNTSPEAGK